MTMIKLITTVGTSLFENYLKTKEDIRTYYKQIKEKSYREHDEYLDVLGKVRKAILNFYDSKRSMDISAEIKSIYKIKDYLKDNIDVYLIATDTIASYLAAEIIKEFLLKDDIKAIFNPKLDVISGLQVANKEIFINKGLINLIKRIDEISEGYYGNVVFNISGGYKASIPYITIMAQINGCNIYYVFEDTEELISIPCVPLSIDIEIFEKYRSEFAELESCIENYNEWEKRHFEFTNIAKSCIERIGHGACLSPLGLILWENYKNRYNIFFATQNVIDKINNSINLARKIIKFLNEDKIRESKTQQKGIRKHMVYDDGNNDYRIAYSLKDNQIYIYAVFDYEPDEIKFLNDPKQSNRVEDYNYKPYKIDKQSLMIYSLG